LKDCGTVRGEELKMDLGTLVAAVLRPHHGKDPELGEVGLTFQDLDDSLILFLAETMAGDGICVDGWLRKLFCA
jgi:hypothetical protein